MGRDALMAIAGGFWQIKKRRSEERLSYLIKNPGTLAAFHARGKPVLYVMPWYVA